MTLPDPQEQGINPDPKEPAFRPNISDLKFPATEMDLGLELPPEEYKKQENYERPEHMAVAKWMQSELYFRAARCEPACELWNRQDQRPSWRPVCTCGSLYVPSLSHASNDD